MEVSPYSQALLSSWLFWLLGCKLSLILPKHLYGVTAAPDLDKEFRVEADASNYATGGVLSMKCSDEMWRPVTFISKSLSDTEKNYEIHDKEMLAVVRYLEAWRHFLEGAAIKFEIWTDHKNLEYFMKAQKLNRRQAR